MSTIVEFPWALLGAPLFAAAITTLLWLAYRRRARRLSRLGTGSLVARLLPPAAMQAPWPRMLLLSLASAFAAVAFAGPHWGMETTVQNASGVDVVLALDASLSMMATDDRPNRLERMKEEARRFLALAGGDRIGLVVFAGRSYVMSPLTVDRGALELFIDNLDPSVVGQAGSSVARAIQLGTDVLIATPSGSDKALVLMSDGEAFESEDDIRAASRRAQDKGITIVAVGFGRSAGSTIMIPVPGGMQPKRDADGKIVITRYTPAMLEAAVGDHGTFIPAPVTDKAARIRGALSSLRAEGRTARRATDRRPRYQLFLFPALLLALFDTVMAERRGRRRRASAAASTAVAALLLVMLVPAAAAAQGSDGDRLYREGHYREAAEAYARALQGKPASPRLDYNLGTSLLAAGQLDDAASSLERAAANAKDLDVRYRALYNLGLVFLRQARVARGDDAGQAFAAAADAYRRALRLRPSERDAKWNYELAIHQRHSGGSSPRPDDSPQRPSRSIDRQQAQQLLNSAQREEREAQGKKLHRTTPDRPPGGKDW